MGSESTTEIRDRFGAQSGPRRPEMWHRGLGTGMRVYRWRERSFGEEMELQTEPVSGDRHTAIGRDEL